MTPSKRLLIVSPLFPPTNAADLHRVRMAIPHLLKLGWSVEVLCLSPDATELIQDDFLLRTVPMDQIRVHAVEKSFSLLRAFRVRSLWFRYGRALRKLGDIVIQEFQPDLILFSTTQFPFFSLGPYWKQKHGVPYVLDYQDPWVSTHYQKTGTRPPGGWWKYGPMQALARRMEPTVVRESSGIIAVSPKYMEQLNDYHEGAVPTLHLPFGAPIRDLEFLNHSESTPPTIGRRWLYVGRGGEDFHPMLQMFFDHLRIHREELIASGITIEFHGTQYHSTSFPRTPISDLAWDYHLDQIVHEYPDRIPYEKALRLQQEADVLLLLGSTDAAYSPSKFQALLMFHRPILALAPSDSLIPAMMEHHQAGHVITPSVPKSTQENILLQLLKGAQNIPVKPELTDESMTLKLSEFFLQVLRGTQE
ncbi:MAG: glycosyltransferase [Candidatus Sumerlaeia bacterium]|nr:glycosyltransferase [Candidatus Sumerlaeia bacterium]